MKYDFKQKKIVTSSRVLLIPFSFAFYSFRSYVNRLNILWCFRLIYVSFQVFCDYFELCFVSLSALHDDL